LGSDNIYLNNNNLGSSYGYYLAQSSQSAATPFYLQGTSIVGVASNILANDQGDDFPYGFAFFESSSNLYPQGFDAPFSCSIETGTLQYFAPCTSSGATCPVTWYAILANPNRFQGYLIFYAIGQGPPGGEGPIQLVVECS